MALRTNLKARQRSTSASHDKMQLRTVPKFAGRSYLSPGESITFRGQDAPSKKRDSAEDDFKKDDGTTANPTVLIHKPQSPEDAFTIRTVVAIECEGASDAWYAHMPSRIGHCKTVDLCINALVLGSDCVRGLPGATLSQCYLVLAQAFQSLRLALSSQEAALSDDLLVSIAALAPVEAVLGRHSLIGHSHLEGLTALITSRPAPARDKITDVTRSILDYYYCDAFITACIRGVASPLEALDSAYYKYPDDTAVTAERKLRALANELYIRLPRLVTLVRAAQLWELKGSLEPALLASVLLRLKDDLAETELLHRVNVKNNATKSARSASLTNCYFHFQTVADYEAIVSYWEARLMLIRLCWQIHATDTSEPYLLPLQSQIQADVRRISSSLLMSAEYGRTLKVRGRRRLFALSMITVWAPLGQLSAVLPVGKDCKSGRDWLLAKTNEALVGHTALTARDMDEAAELFVGGAPTGVYAQMYSKYDEREETEVIWPSTSSGFRRKLEGRFRPQVPAR